MIPISELKIRGVYRCHGRNFRYGVWDGEAFVGRRHKFRWRLDSELHHDASKTFGTCNPDSLLCQLPDDIPMVTDFIRSQTPTQITTVMNYALFGFLTILEDDLSAP